MGAEESKAETQHNGENQIKIVNTQVQHSETLDSHTTLLWIVLAGMVIQITITVYLEVQRRFRKRIVKKAADLMKLKEVTVNQK